MTFLDSKELAERWKTTRQTVRRWHREGIIPQGVVHGERLILWSIKEIEVYEESLKQQNRGSKNVCNEKEV